MLTELFGNSPKTKILDFLLSSPNEEFTKTELANGSYITRVTLNKFIKDFLSQEIILITIENKYELNNKSELVDLLKKIKSKIEKRNLSDEIKYYRKKRVREEPVMYMKKLEAEPTPKILKSETGIQYCEDNDSEEDNNDIMGNCQIESFEELNDINFNEEKMFNNTISLEEKSKKRNSINKNDNEDLLLSIEKMFNKKMKELEKNQKRQEEEIAYLKRILNQIK